MTDTGIVKIHGKEYHTVGKRVADFRSKFPNWSIITDILSNTDSVVDGIPQVHDLVVIKASILNDDGRVIATGHAEEKRGSTNINKTSALENCETSAVGRALGMLGMGGTEIASADEVVNAITQQNQPTKRIVFDTVNSTQVKELSKYCLNGQETTATGDLLLKAYNISSVSELPASRFNEAIARCKKRAESE